MTRLTGLNIEENFPTIITPQSHLKNSNELTALLQTNQAALAQLLLKHGALLFRGFPLQNAANFANAIEALAFGNFVNYIGGDSPRDKVEQKIYTSTEAPPAFHIHLHQELSFIKKFPRHIYFFCETAAPVGGSTIIGDARRVYAALKPSVRERFQEKQLTYTARYYHKSKIMAYVNRIQRSHKSWTEVFETNDKHDVERKCVENEFNWRWLQRDWIELTQTRPAIITHPLTNETVWFNQAHLYDFSPRLLGWKNYLAAKVFYCRKSTRLHEITFADGSTIPRKDLYHVLDVLDANTVAYPWQRGDFMVLDNILCMHGRAPFSGKRRVLTAMTTV